MCVLKVFSIALFLSFYIIIKLSSSHYINNNLGSGEPSGKMLLVRIIENNKIDAYFRSG